MNRRFLLFLLALTFPALSLCQVPALPAIDPGQTGNTGAAPSPGLSRRPPEAPGSRDPSGKKIGRISIDLTVTDVAGKPVAGLTERDFSLLDNLQPREILSFNPVSETPAIQDATQAILLIDAVNNTFESIAAERDQIEKVLARDGGRLPIPMSIAVFFNTDVKINQPTRDGNVLRAELKKMPIGIRSIDTAMGGEGAMERFQLSLKTLNQLLTYEGTKPGRKLLIWIGPGWPLLAGAHFESTMRSKSSEWNAIVSFSANLRRARTTLYSVDSLSSGTSLMHNSFYKNYLKAVARAQDADSGNLALPVLAVQSGGRVLNASNDLASEITSCLEDASAYYTLSFNIPAAETVDEYHSLDVKLAQASLIARTTAGYYAQPNPEWEPLHR